MNNPLVSVIIVNWNGRRFLEDCLGSLSAISYKNIEILFVDNASIDDSVSFVEKHFPKIKIIQNKTNLGLSGGHDVAFANAKGDAILLLNTDTIVEKNLLLKLIDVLYDDKRYGAVQPKILLPGKNVIDSIGSFFLTNGDLYHFGREKNPHLSVYNRQMEIFSTKGACMLIKKEVLKKTGLFDKDFFAYFEDTDLCMRIWLAGYKIIYTPDVTIFHKGGGASEQMMRSYILFHSYKNRILTYLKNFSLKYLFRVFPIMIIMYQFVFVLYILMGKFGYALAIQRAILWNIRYIKKTLQKRKLVQNSIRIIKDDDYIPSVTRYVRPSYYFYQIFGGMEKYID